MVSKETFLENNGFLFSGSRLANSLDRSQFKYLLYSPPKYKHPLRKYDFVLILVFSPKYILESSPKSIDHWFLFII